MLEKRTQSDRTGKLHWTANMAECIGTVDRLGNDQDEGEYMVVKSRSSRRIRVGSEELPPSPPSPTRARQDQENLTVRLKGIERNVTRLWLILVAREMGKITGETTIHSAVRRGNELIIKCNTYNQARAFMNVTLFGWIAV